jgi:tetratricopeptide (TPR) repeat protein
VNNVWAAAILVGQLDAAEKKLIGLVALHPHLFQLLYTLGIGYVSQGRLQEARTSLQLCAAVGSFDASTKGKDTGRDNKDRKKGRGAAKSDDIFLRPHCRAALSNLLIKQGHCEEALEVLVDAVEEDSWFAPLHGALAAVRLRRGEPALALSHAQEAIALRRDVVVYRMQAALAARAAGNVSQALQVLEEGEQLLGQDDMAAEATLNLVMAELSQPHIGYARGGPQSGMRRFRAKLCWDRCSWQVSADLYGGGEDVLGIPIFDAATRRTLRYYKLAARALRRQRAAFEACQRLHAPHALPHDTSLGEEEEEEDSSGRKLSQLEMARLRESNKTRAKFAARLAAERARNRPPPPPPPTPNKSNTSNDTAASPPPLPPPPPSPPAFEGAETSAALLKCGRAPPPTEVLRVKAAIADIFAALAAWPEAAAAHETVLQARPGHVSSLMGKASAAAARGDYASVGEAVELAQVYGLRLYLAPSDIKVLCTRTCQLN